MTGKKVLIVLGVVLLGAAVVAANLYYRRDTGLSVAGRGTAGTRPGSDRLGIGQSAAQASGERLCQHHGTRNSRRCRRGPAREGRTVPPRDRSEATRGTDAARRSQRRRRPIVAAIGAHASRARAREPRPRPPESEASGGSLERRTDDARESRASAERGRRSRSRSPGRGRRTSKRTKLESGRSRPACRRRATT